MVKRERDREREGEREREREKEKERERERERERWEGQSKESILSARLDKDENNGIRIEWMFEWCRLNFFFCSLVLLIDVS